MNRSTFVAEFKIVWMTVEKIKAHKESFPLFSSIGSYQLRLSFIRPLLYCLSLKITLSLLISSCLLLSHCHFKGLILITTTVSEDLYNQLIIGWLNLMMERDMQQESYFKMNHKLIINDVCAYLISACFQGKFVLFRFVLERKILFLRFFPYEIIQNLCKFSLNLQFFNLF